MIQSLRALEFATGIALLLSPDKCKELLAPLVAKTTETPMAREAKGLRSLLG